MDHSERGGVAAFGSEPGHRTRRGHIDDLVVARDVAVRARELAALLGDGSTREDSFLDVATLGH